MAEGAAVGVSSRSRKSGGLAAWLTSTILIVFTLVIGLLCVLVLSCTLTQTRMSSISIDGVNVSIWKLDDIRKQWTDIRKQIRAQADSLTEAEKEATRRAFAACGLKLDRAALASSAA